MGRFRILDGNMPGYERVTAGTFSSAPVNGPSVGSPVLSTAWAEKYLNYVPPEGEVPPVTGAFTQWRVLAPLGARGGPSSEWYVGEMKMYDDTGADVTSQATPSSSTAASTRDPARLVDGDYNTSGGVWLNSPSGGSWIQFTFPTAKKIRRVRLWTWVPQGTGYIARRLTVQGSVDGSRWVNVWSTAAAPDSTEQDMTIVPGVFAPPVPIAVMGSGSYNGGAYDPVNGVADDSAASYRVLRIADGDINTQWLTARVGPNNIHWARLDFGSATQAVGYKLYVTQGNANAGWVPTRWKVQGSNDGVAWSDLDDRTASAFNWSSQTVEGSDYMMQGTITGSFRYFRLYMPPQSGAGDCHAIAEFTIIGA